MSKHLLIPLLMLAFNATALAGIKMVIGDGLIDGARLEPYELIWRQCSFQDGLSQPQGTLSEALVVIGDVVRHRQSTVQPNGAVSRSDTYFERSTLAPLRMEVEATMDGSRLVYVEREFDADGYTGFTMQGDQSKTLQGSISANMLHGGAMGLPLAAMNFQEEPVEFLASMVGFDATYTVNAEWVGREMLEFDGQKIESWLIDVEWHHRESGDVYPPGPDASGGRYWVVPSPPEGYPYVPRYKTDTYAVEFDTHFCLAVTD
ncbi:MAG: hypothetical protein ACR2RD_14555 [Woeseiaceae bacterium]